MTDAQKFSDQVMNKNQKRNLVQQRALDLWYAEPRPESLQKLVEQSKDLENIEDYLMEQARNELDKESKIEYEKMTENWKKAAIPIEPKPSKNKPLTLTKEEREQYGPSINYISIEDTQEERNDAKPPIKPQGKRFGPDTLEETPGNRPDAQVKFHPLTGNTNEIIAQQHQNNTIQTQTTEDSSRIISPKIEGEQLIEDVKKRTNQFIKAVQKLLNAAGLRRPKKNENIR